MPKSIIAEGKTTTEAISNGLKELKVSKDRVEIKVLEEHEKRSFFSILAPRVVKVELTLKEDNNKTDNIKRNTEKDIHNKSNKISKEDLESARTRVETFLKDFVSNFENLNYNVHMDAEEGFIKIEINGEDSKTLIGYRGEVLNALQVILNSIANKDSKEKARVILNVNRTIYPHCHDKTSNHQDHNAGNQHFLNHRLYFRQKVVNLGYQKNRTFRSIRI